MSRAVVGTCTARGRTGEQLHLILTLSGHGTYKARQGKASQVKARQGKARLYNVRAHSIAEKELLCNRFTEVERNVAVPRVRASVFVLCMGGCVGVGAVYCTAGARRAQHSRWISARVRLPLSSTCYVFLFGRGVARHASFISACFTPSVAWQNDCVFNTQRDRQRNADTETLLGFRPGNRFGARRSASCERHDRLHLPDR